ncbi:MAG: AraC family transcriptional regulator [Oscillospiraceae bacterium]|nr:AraC family transcriptional regulator [Oscillospiraceae bacterium]
MVFPQISCSDLLRGKLPINVLTDCQREQDTLHMHNYADLFYVISGSVTFTIDGITYELSSGACVFVPPYTPHTMNSLNSDPTPIVISASFCDSFFTDRGYSYFSYIGSLANFDGYRIPVYTEFKNEKRVTATSTVKSLSREFLLKENMNIEKLAELLAGLLRLMCESIGNEKISVNKNLSTRANAITLSVKHIAAHYSEKLTIDTLAALSAMSRATFIRNFEMICGTTVSNFIFCVRMHNARRLILFTEKSLNEIAKQVGLHNKSRLCTAFQEVYGMTTTEHKLRYRPIENKSRYYGNRYWSWLDGKTEINQENKS